MPGLRAAAGRLQGHHTAAMPRPPEHVSTRPLIDKLGVKPDARVALVNLMDLGLEALLATRTSDVTYGKPAPDTDLIFLGANSIDELGGLSALRSHLRPDGGIWVVFRKGKAATLRDVDVIEAAVANGLVDNKVVSFSETHTSQRLVIPRAMRPSA